MAGWSVSIGSAPSSGSVELKGGWVDGHVLSPEHVGRHTQAHIDTMALGWTPSAIWYLAAV